LALDPRVRSVIQKINKKHGHGTVILGSDISQAIHPTITSGSLSFDAALGGGWATNHWVEIVGNESAGKTAIILKTIAVNQKRDPDWTVVWFATEDFVDEYALMWGCDLSRIILQETNTMEVVYESAIEFLETKGIDCIVIDSLPAMVPAREQDGEMEDFQPGLVAFLTGKFFRKSNPSMKRSMTEEERPCTGFVINQWRDKIISYGDPRTTPGGKGKNFFFFQRVDIKREEFITNTKREPIGQTIKMTVIKNKLGRPRRTGQVDAYISKTRDFNAGDYDIAKDVVSAALAYDVITRPKKGYYAFGEEQWYGRPRLDEALYEDPKLRGRVKRAVIAAASKPLPPRPTVGVKKTVRKATNATKKRTQRPAKASV
jgi:recombination protein RecA